MAQGTEEIHPPVEVANMGVEEAGGTNNSNELGRTGLTSEIPSTGNSGSPSSELHKVTQISPARSLASKLTSLLGKRQPEPSPKLKQLLQSFSPNPADAIMSQIKNLGKINAHFSSIKIFGPFDSSIDPHAILNR